MNRTSVTSGGLRSLTAYLAVGLACVPILTAILQLWKADWRVPFSYVGDSMFYSMLIKSICDNGWFLHNGFLGMPWGADLHDFPLPDIWHWFFIKLAALLTSDHALILNLAFLATFPLAALAALWVFRQFQVAWPPAVLGSLLYAFLPYHFYRGEPHLFLGAYYTVPLMVLVLLWVCAAGGETGENDPNALRLSLRNRKFVLSVGICILMAVSSTAVYYAFFACCLLMAAGVVAAISRRTLRELLVPGVLTAIICGTLLFNLLPNFVYWHEHGKGASSERLVGEAEIYGLKIAQLLLPVRRHWVNPLGQLRYRYNYTSPMVNENDDSTLGLIGSAGFLVLVGWLLARGFCPAKPLADRKDRLLGHLGALNLSAVLLGTVGGFGVLFALLVSPQLRAYNRISVYIAFFSIFAVVLLLDHVSQRWCQTQPRRVVFGSAMALLALLGLADQTCSRYIPHYGSAIPAYRNDADFVQRIERALPAGASVFQLPVSAFPESHPIIGNDLFKGYLHSKRLRWSYGAMSDRESHRCQQAWASKPLPEMIETVAITGFSGLYVDRLGYTNHAVALEADLSGILGAGPQIVSADGRLSFFDLAPFQQRLREKLPAQELEARRQRALHPPALRWQGGFHTPLGTEESWCVVLSFKRGFRPFEGTPEDPCRWCGPTGELKIENPIPQPRRVALEMSLSTESPGNLRIESPFFTDTLKVGSIPVRFSRAFIVPPGAHAIKFSCDAPRVNERCDTRVLVLRVQDFRWRVAD